MYTASKTFHFNAAHRIMDHNGVCKNVHGHNYKCIVNCDAKALDDKGMVLDFKEMKVLQTRLDENRDHSYLYQDGDEIGEYLASKGMRTYKLDSAPSTEILAKLIYDQAIQLGLPASSVELRETPKCKAIFAG